MGATGFPTGGAGVSCTASPIETPKSLESCIEWATLKRVKTITITEAKRSLGQYLKRAAAGEDIGIVSGADIIYLRKVEVMPTDRIGSPTSSLTVDDEDWPVFEAVDGGPADGALHHDRYLYADPHGDHAGKGRP